MGDKDGKTEDVDDQRWREKLEDTGEYHPDSGEYHPGEYHPDSDSTFRFLRLLTLATESPSIRLTMESARVLKAVINAGRAHGSMVMDSTKLPSGTVYPILARLETSGLLVSEWEDGEASELGRPLRRYYSATEAGRLGFDEALGGLAS